MLITRFFSRPGDQPIDRRLEVLHADRRSCPSRAASSAASLTRLRQIGAGESGGPRRDDLEVDVGRDLHALGVDPQDLLAALDVRLVHEHLAIEAAGTEQRRIEHLGPVGRAHDDHALARVEAVHLGEQLIERLLALLVAAERALHARLAERVELVDEDDARAPSLRPAGTRSRMRAAPTPTNISTNSDPLRLKKGTCASPATARASSVLPVPGGPTSEHALRESGRRGSCSFFGFLRNSTISFSSSSASSTPATSENRTFTSSSA